uniref:Bidirectional sugar transporter SWEET n=1 Tax=Setaria italica TaxID=4555 RepID=K3XKQ5_SETIT
MSSLYDISCFAAGVAGNIFALALFLSPVPTFKRVVKAKSTERFDGLPYLLSLLNCCICLWYGLPWVSDGGRTLVATVNGTGALFQLAYISLFIFYADSRSTRLKITGILLLEVFVFAFVAHASIAFLDQPARQLFIGGVSMASLISMFASPLAVMGLVIRTECVEFMPFYLSLSTFLMSASFTMSPMGLESSWEQCSWCCTLTTAGNGRAVNLLHRCSPEQNRLDQSAGCSPLLGFRKEGGDGFLKESLRGRCYYLLVAVYTLFCPGHCAVHCWLCAPSFLFTYL